jgi:C4-dicarboxylate-specific signal transduction histidine kinase
MSDILNLRKLLEQRSSLSTELEDCFRAALDASSDGMVVVGADGTVHYANPAAARILSCTIEELVAMPCPLPLPADTVREVTITTDQDGALTVQLQSLATVWQGEPAQLVALRDITGQKQLEQQLQEQAAKIVQLDGTVREQVRDEVDKSRERDHLLLLQSRSTATGEMIGNVAHQWRQPLTAISLLIQDLRECYVYGEFSKEYLDTTVSNALNIIQHMSQTIDDFRNFFRQDKEKQAFSVREVIERSLSFIAASLRYYSTTVEISVDDDLIAHGYPNEFSQVLLNIIGNAKETFRERGTANPLIQIRAFREGRRTVVTITDNGGGIAEDAMDHIFEPYFTTRTAGNGTGLGLSMSKTIIERNMDGTLTACNVPGGAQFRIEV